MYEKLIELIQSAVNGCATYWAGIIADHLIYNGVTIPVRCINCQSHEPCEVRNRVWCRQMGRYMKEDGFCSEGKVKDNG